MALSGLCTIEEMADMSGLSERTISNLRGGPISGVCPNLSSIEKVSTSFGLSPSVLMWSKEDARREAQLCLSRQYLKKSPLFESGRSVQSQSDKARREMKLESLDEHAQAAGLICAFATRSLEAGASVARQHDHFNEEGEILPLATDINTS